MSWTGPLPEILERMAQRSTSWIPIAVMIVVASLGQPARGGDPIEGSGPQLLSGELDEGATTGRHDAGVPTSDTGLGEDGRPLPRSPLAGLPRVSTELRRQVESFSPEEMLRVIVYLRHLPQEKIAAEIEANHAEATAELRNRAKQILQASAARRDTTLPRDMDNWDEMTRQLPAEREALNQVHLEHEALSLRIKNELTDALRAEMAPHFSRVGTLIASLGGEVESSTLAGSLVIARLPVGQIDNLALSPDVLQVGKDHLLHSHLDIATSAAILDAAGGPWDSGQTGGAYDPAIIDTGLDNGHPGMENRVSPLRNNFNTWYLVAGADHPDFNDVFNPDDLQGHGTHVCGIVGSYGAAAWPDHLGFSFGVEKLVNLKAGWNSDSPSSSGLMLWSDLFNIVERAININDQLQPPGTFNDDVDGFNLSFGSETVDDETPASRFWDSVISTYADTPVTISAGNDGPSNSLFSTLASSYNAIAVGNANDKDTVTRADDTMAPSSSRGPTANGRRKPEISAPGTSIWAPNHQYETEIDYVPKSGTSMSAPAVLGVIMDLMDGGVFDELAIKALLINTAQKNMFSMNFENLSDGWHEQRGFGLLHAHSAFLHRTDVFLDSVTPRNTAGDYHLYKGVMRDEGSTPPAEGRDRATLVWNRHATYNPAAAPSTYYTLVDLNLRLYREATGGLIDADQNSIDNVHQVRIDEDRDETEVVVKVYSWSTSFAHGGASQTYALATEENFSRVDLPTDFQGFASRPTSVEPLEEFQVEFWIRNDSDVASHSNFFNLQLPQGFELVEGIDTQNVASIDAGGYSTHVFYTIRAPATLGAASFSVQHSHNSYGEAWGPFNWNVGLTVQFDFTPPSPDPMSFSSTPAAISTSAVEMTASFATDLHRPVEYLHDSTGSPSGGGGGTDSGWQESRSYSDGGLDINQDYCYIVWARDNSLSRNVTSPSPLSCAFTLANPPLAEPFGESGHNAIEVRWSANGNPDGTEYRAHNLTEGTNSGWITDSEWTDTLFTAGDSHSYAVEARNGDGVETNMVPIGTVHTPIFSDGFESGDTVAWSSTVP